MPGHRIANAEKDRRVAEVLDFILQGWRRESICRVVSEKWGLTSRSAERYMREARRELQVILKQTKAENLAEHLAHRQDLRRRAREAGDMRVELEVGKDEAKLLDLYPAERRVNIDYSKLTDNQLDRIIAGEDPFIVVSTTADPSSAGKEAAETVH